MLARLPCKKEHHQHSKSHHVRGEPKENKGAEAVQPVAGTTPRAVPVIVTTATSAASGPPVYRRFPAYSWLLPFNLRRCAREGNWHG
jgi:hypothetical protein